MLFWLSSFFFYFSFSTVHYHHNTFFNDKFHSYILTVYSYPLYQGLWVVFNLENILISFLYIRRLIISWDFVNFIPLSTECNHYHKKLQWREWVFLEEFTLLSLPLSCFPWFLRIIFLLCRIFCRFSDFLSLWDLFIGLLITILCHSNIL